MIAKLLNWCSEWANNKALHQRVSFWIDRHGRIRATFKNWNDVVERTVIFSDEPQHESDRSKFLLDKFAHFLADNYQLAIDGSESTGAILMLESAVEEFCSIPLFPESGGQETLEERRARVASLQTVINQAIRTERASCLEIARQETEKAKRSNGPFCAANCGEIVRRIEERSARREFEQQAFVD